MAHDRCGRVLVVCTLVLFFVCNVLISSQNLPLRKKVGSIENARVENLVQYVLQVHKAIEYPKYLVGTSPDIDEVKSEVLQSVQSTTNQSEAVIDENTPSNELLNTVDITFVRSDSNVTTNPNFGARDENGKEGYVPDLTRLRNNPPRFSLGGTELEEACSLRDDDWDAMQRIKLVDSTMEWRPRSKILCAVYSAEQYHREKLPAVLETWAGRCDGFMVASNKTDPSLYTVDIPHVGPEAYNNMWQKVRSMWGYIYDNFYEDYDWFHVGGDDMWVIVENLRYYLDSPEIRNAAFGGHSKLQVPLYLGATLAHGGNMEELYQTGGPGYTLNKAALKLLVLQGLPVYHTRLRKPIEDLLIGQIFRALGVKPFRTTTENNSVRYNHFPPGRHYGGREPFFYRKQYTENLNYTRGKEHSAVYSVSFHYLSPPQMRKVHALLYGHCKGKGNRGLGIRHPQPPQLGRYAAESAYPFLSTDIWHELVDNNRTFFVRPEFVGNLRDDSGWLKWLDEVPWPIKLVTNNNFDWTWPNERISITPKVLEHPNLERLYTMNPLILHPKVTPIPIGHKWQFRSTDLYGEPKGEILTLLHTVSKSANETKSLFLNPRSPSVWVPPYANRRGYTYMATNDALRTPPNNICGILTATAPRATACSIHKAERKESLSQMKMHRFVASPPGTGLDTHLTWEILLAGAIPIVPRSTLDPLFEDLPVWFIESWDEVTDDAVLARSQEFLSSADTFNWEKIFATGWKKEFQR